MKSPKNQDELKILQTIQKFIKLDLIKTYIGYKGYTIYKISLNDEIIKYIKEYLIAKPFSLGTYNEPTKFPLYMESNSKLYVPRFWGIKMFGCPKEIKISFGKPVSLQFAGKLRDYQVEVVNKYLKDVNAGVADEKNNGTSGGLICLSTGGGKTTISLNIITHIRKKTIIFVHQSFLKDQWIERIMQFLPSARVGQIQGQVIDIEDKDIVIAMIQSISMKEYPETIFADFGFSIYDECFPANTQVITNIGKVKIIDLYKIWTKFGTNNNIDVLSYNIKRDEFQPKRLTYAWKKSNCELLKFILLDNCSFSCTSNHKILTSKGYIEANTLKIGDKIMQKDWNNKATSTKILNIINEYNYELDVYDIEVEDNHNYIINNGIIVSNCHHLAAETFSNCLRKCTTLYTLGLSATVDRKDGLTYVLKMYMGDIVYKNKDQIDDFNVIVKAIDYVVPDDDEYNYVDRDYRGNAMLPKIISRLSKTEHRNQFILHVLKCELKVNPGQQIMVLAHNKSLLIYLYKHIDFTTKGYYVGGMKQKDLKESETKQIVLATYSMAAEGLDIKTLSSLFLASSKSDVVQSVGRILREKHDSHLIIDLIDSHDPFQRQYEKRKALYKEREYKILRTNNSKYIDYYKAVHNSEKSEINISDFWEEYKYKLRQIKKTLNNELNTLSQIKPKKCLINIE